MNKLRIICHHGVHVGSHCPECADEVAAVVVASKPPATTVGETPLCDRLQHAFVAEGTSSFYVQLEKLKTMERASTAAQIEIEQLKAANARPAKGPLLPRPETVRMANHILNHYAKDSRKDHICLARRLEKWAHEFTANSHDVSIGEMIDKEDEAEMGLLGRDPTLQFVRLASGYNKLKAEVSARYTVEEVEAWIRYLGWGSTENTASHPGVGLSAFTANQRKIDAFALAKELGPKISLGFSEWELIARAVEAQLEKRK